MNIDFIISKAKSYLDDFGLELEILDENDAPIRVDDDWVGQYEHDSVWTGTIQVYLNMELIKRLSDEFCSAEEENNIVSTLYHEIGHGLLDMIIELPEESVEAYENDPEFFDIFNDDNMSEEDIVEEFGESFVGGHPSLLRKLLERMLEDDFDFPF
jgi:Zn-dependent oligopeptidase